MLLACLEKTVFNAHFNAPNFFVFGLMLFYGGGGGYHNLAKRRRLTKGC